MWDRKAGLFKRKIPWYCRQKKPDASIRVNEKNSFMIYLKSPGKS